MIELGYYKGRKLVIFYHESENYEYTDGLKSEFFKTNSGLNAIAKTFHDLGLENITISNEGKFWYDLYQKNKIIYESTIMEHAIGLSNTYDLKNLVNSNGEKLKRYKCYRNYYNTNPNCDNYQEVQELVNKHFMKEIAPNYFAVTWQGYYWLECKYDLKIIKDED